METRRKRRRSFGDSDSLPLTKKAANVTNGQVTNSTSLQHLAPDVEQAETIVSKNKSVSAIEALPTEILLKILEYAFPLDFGPRDQPVELLHKREHVWSSATQGSQYH